MIKKLLFSICISCIILSSSATPVDMNDAIKVAGNFVKGRVHQFASASSYTFEIDNAKPLVSEEVMAYVINLKKGGFVIVAAESASKPILAYSFEGSFITDQMPVQVREWMNIYYSKINDIRLNNIQPTTEIEMEWNSLLNGDIRNRDNREITPLLTTTWDQGIRYNELCPADPQGSGGHVYSGCVATAMSQVINYWRYPLQGTGSHGYYSDYGYLFVNFADSHYDYNQMNNSIGGESNYEMAEIQYHCGVAVDMGYSPNGSGAYSTQAAESLKEYFGYSNNLKLELKEDYSDEEWANLLIENLDNGWPMYYHGFGSGGHAFNVDGYQGGDYFHFNWGWSGSYNGYFYLSNLNPGGSDFSIGQGAIVNFYPQEANYPYYCSGVTVLSRHNGTIEDGSGPVNNYFNGLSCGWLVAPEDSVSGLTLNFEKFDIAEGDVINVFDGANSSAPLVGSYTGSNIPEAISSESGNLYIEFLTSNNTGKGFRANYKSTLVNYCPDVTNFNEPSATFTDGSGNRNYRDKSICRYIIEPENAASITLSFDEFNTEATFDKFGVYDMISQQQVASFSGNQIPDDITIPSGKIYILFISNDSISSSGWQVTYTSIVTGTDDYATAGNTTVFCSPNPADEWLRIELRSRNSEKIEISLVSTDGRATQLYKGMTNSEPLILTPDVSAYTPGLYLVKYKSESTNGSIKVIIK